MNLSANSARTFALYVSLALAGAVLPVGAAFASNLDFDLDNETNVNIVSLYLSLNAQSDWGDAIDNGATNANATNSITFDSDAHGDNCYYDFKLVFANGVVSYLYNINLCSVEEIDVDTTDDGHVKYIATYLTDDSLN